MDGKFAIIGLGQFGYRVAEQLALKGAEVLAIDRDLETVERIKDDVAYAIALDSTDIKSLRSQNVQEMDAVLVAIGENIEGLLLTTVLLLELGVERIIARAMSEEQKMILEKLGVREILSPEDEVGLMVAEMLLNPTMKAYLPLPDEYQISEIKTPINVVRKTLSEIDFGGNYNLTLITIKRSYEEYTNKKKILVYHLVQKINRETIIQPMDMLVLMGKTYDIEKFITINS